MNNEACGVALTFYPFCWKLGFWRLTKVWIVQVGPIGAVLSLQRTWGPRCP